MNRVLEKYVSLDATGSWSSMSFKELGDLGVHGWKSNYPSKVTIALRPAGSPFVMCCDLKNIAQCLVFISSSSSPVDESSK